MEIPPERLSPATLQALLEAVVLREGTDYGAREVSFAAKVAALRREVLARRVAILYDARTATCNLVPRRELPPSA